MPPAITAWADQRGLIGAWPCPAELCPLPSLVPGKSDPIDALAVARATLQEPKLPQARLDGPAREIKLLVGHREDLVAERSVSEPVTGTLVVLMPRGWLTGAYR